MIFKIARFLRHGPFRRLSPVWVFLGKVYRWIFSSLNLSRPVEHYIGPYGPFMLDGYFAFSDFKRWGVGHNNGFEACVEACRNAKCFIDVGAHIGLVTIPAAKVMEGRGEVHAFEPSAVNLVFLKRHVAANCLRNISVTGALLGDENILVDFFETDYPNGQNSKVPTSRVTTYRQCKRQQLTLDEYVLQNKIEPEIIKIDVEGAETAVLKGARETLKLYKPLIFLSIHPTELAETPDGLEGLIELIHKCGYRCCKLDGSDATEFKLSEYVLKYET